MCKHVHIYASVYVCHICWAVCLYFVELSVCFSAAGQGGLVSIWINKAASSGCSWDDVIRTFFLHVWVRVAADQCGSNHPTGAV